MAGAGYKLFNTGDVLTAAQVNTYLQEQVVMVFANATARTTALSGVLAEGMMSYLQDTNAVEVYDGTAWVSIGSSGDITGVTAGTGISGGGTSGTVTITNSMATEITAAGDIIVGTGSGTFDNLPIGTTGQVLTADTTVSPYKVKWASAGSAFVGVSVEHSDFQTISNATFTAVQFDQEVFDTDGFHSTSSNNTRLTVPTGKGGYYRITGFGVFTRNATGLRSLAIYKNGTQERYFPEVTASSSVYEGAQGTVTLNLSAGDYIEFFVYQSSGGNLDYRANLGGGYTQAGHEMIYLGA